MVVDPLLLLPQTGHNLIDDLSVYFVNVSQVRSLDRSMARTAVDGYFSHSLFEMLPRQVSDVDTSFAFLMYPEVLGK